MPERAGERSPQGEDPASYAGPDASAEEILAAWIAEWDTTMMDTPKEHAAGARGIIASLERVGFVIVNPSKLPTPEWAAIAGGIKANVRAEGEVIRSREHAFGPDFFTAGHFCQRCGIRSDLAKPGECEGFNPNGRPYGPGDPEFDVKQRDEDALGHTVSRADSGLWGCPCGFSTLDDDLAERHAGRSIS